MVGVERESRSLPVSECGEEATMQESESVTAARPLVLSVGEAATLLGISRAHAYELVARGELPHLRLGRRVVVPKHAIEALLASVDAHQ